MSKYYKAFHYYPVDVRQSYTNKDVKGFKVPANRINYDNRIAADVENLKQQLERERYTTNKLKHKYNELERNINREAERHESQKNTIASEKDFEINELQRQIDQTIGERRIIESQYQKLLKKNEELHELLQHKDHDIESWRMMNHMQNKDKEKAIEEAKHFAEEFACGNRRLHKAEIQEDPEIEQREIRKIQRISNYESKRKPILDDLFKRKSTEAILEEMEIQREENKSEIRPQERPEEVKVEDTPERLGLSQNQTSISQSTSSYGRATISQEATADIVDQQEILYSKVHSIRLQDRFIQHQNMY